MARPKIHENRATYTIRAPRELLAELDETAKKMGTAKNDVVLTAIRAFLKGSPETPAKVQSETPPVRSVTTETCHHAIRVRGECRTCGHRLY